MSAEISSNDEQEQNTDKLQQQLSQLMSSLDLGFDALRKFLDNKRCSTVLCFWSYLCMLCGLTGCFGAD